MSNIIYRFKTKISERVVKVTMPIKTDNKELINQFAVESLIDQLKLKTISPLSQIIYLN